MAGPIRPFRHANMLWRVLVAAVGLARTVVVATGCSCAEQKWCAPITTPPPTHEIYAFAVAGGGQLTLIFPFQRAGVFWSHLSPRSPAVLLTIMSLQPDCRCHDHSAVVRIQLECGEGQRAALTFIGPRLACTLYYTHAPGRLVRQQPVCARSCQLGSTCMMPVCENC